MLKRYFSPFVSISAGLAMAGINFASALARSIIADAPKDQKPYRGYRKPGRYTPHQSKRECARRVRQMEKGRGS